MDRFKQGIPLARPWLGAEECELVQVPLNSGWVTLGPEVAAFEEAFAAFVGAKNACAVSSCTAALHLALLSLGVGDGDEVVTVSHSFIATANAVRFVGATPVFVDVDPGTFNINPEAVADALNDRTKAILCVHQIGMPCDLRALSEISKRTGLPLVEDAACAIGSEIETNGEWQRIGRPHGVIACFSFHPRKLLTTGDGGMLTTDDDQLDQRFRQLRHHGKSGETYSELGFNYRLTDIQASVGRVQLGRVPEMVRVRRNHAERYRELLADCPEVGLPEEPDWARSNWQSYCVRLPAGIDPRDVMEAMSFRDVATGRGIMCAHLEPAYAEQPWRSADGGLVESERALRECLLLPMFHDLTDGDLQTVVDTLKEILGGLR
jgi:dTDP-4-amino-4,6-dideoxygalactose transaminase